MTASLLIDVVILTLLVLALTWGVILARRIARLQSALIEFAPVLQAFSDAVDQGERSIETLREEAQKLEELDRKRASISPRAAVELADLPVKNQRQAMVRTFFEAARAKVTG